MIEQISAILFSVLVVSAITWLILILRLFHILRTRHAEIYDTLGRPSLILNNTIRNNFTTLRFLLGGHFRQLRDPELLRLGAFMQILFYAYSTVFAALLVLFFVGIPSQHTSH
jgi:hypothetical protein